jgi:hypothetical protein
MTDVMTGDRSGNELGRVKENLLMEHPINTAMRTVQGPKKAGVAPKPRDLLVTVPFESQRDQENPDGTQLNRIPSRWRQWVEHVPTRCSNGGKCGLTEPECF